MGNLEQFENDSQNMIQVLLAKDLYAEMDLGDDEIMNHWVSDGYAKRFREYVETHPEIEEKIAENEKEALLDIKQNVLFH